MFENSLPLLVFQPYGLCQGTLLVDRYSDELERQLWRGRVLDGRKVGGTCTDLDKLPRFIPSVDIGRLS